MLLFSSLCPSPFPSFTELLNNTFEFLSILKVLYSLRETLLESGLLISTIVPVLSLLTLIELPSFGLISTCDDSPLGVLTVSPLASSVAYPTPPLIKKETITANVILFLSFQFCFTNLSVLCKRFIVSLYSPLS